MVLAGASEQNGLHGVSPSVAPSVSPPGVSCSEPGVNCSEPGGQKDEADQYLETVEKLASESQDLVNAWGRTREMMDFSINENLHDLAYSIARGRVIERIANMGGGSIVGTSRSEQDGGGRGRSRTREPRSGGLPPSVGGDISRLISDYELSLGRLGPNGETEPSALGTVPAWGEIIRGEDAPVLTGFDLTSALASRDIGEIKHKLCEVHDLAAQQETTLDDLYEEMTRMMDNNHRLALKLIDREKELEMVKEALVLATEGGLVGDAPSSSSGDDAVASSASAASVSASASAAYLSPSFSASDPPHLELVSTGMTPPPRPRPPLSASATEERREYYRRYSGLDFDVLVEDRAAGSRGTEAAEGGKAFDREQRGVSPSIVKSGRDQGGGDILDGAERDGNGFARDSEYVKGGEGTLYRNGHETEPGNAQSVGSNGCVVNLPPPPPSTAATHEQCWSPPLDQPLVGEAGEGEGARYARPSASASIDAGYTSPAGAYGGAGDEFGLVAAIRSPACDSVEVSNSAASEGPADWANGHTCENRIAGAGMPPLSSPWEGGGARKGGAAADGQRDGDRDTEGALMDGEDDRGGQLGEDEGRVRAPGDDASGPPSLVQWPASQLPAPPDGGSENYASGPGGDDDATTRAATAAKQPPPLFATSLPHPGQAMSTRFRAPRKAASAAGDGRAWAASEAPRANPFGAHSQANGGRSNSGWAPASVAAAVEAEHSTTQVERGAPATGGDHDGNGTSADSATITYGASVGSYGGSSRFSGGAPQTSGGTGSGGSNGDGDGAPAPVPAEHEAASAFGGADEIVEKTGLSGETAVGVIGESSGDAGGMPVGEGDYHGGNGFLAVPWGAEGQEGDDYFGGGGV